AGAGLAVENLELGLDFIEAHIRQAVAVGVIGVFARVLVDSVSSLGVLAGDLGCGAQGGFGFGEIEVVQGAGHRLQFLFDGPLSDAFALSSSFFQLGKRDLGVEVGGS